MLRFVSRLLGPEPEPYARRVATALLKEGFDPAVLDEMRTLASFQPDGLIFKVLADNRLPPRDAARAIMLADHLYRTTRHSAQAQGWPRCAEVKPDCPKHEAYFLGLLKEAAEVLRKS